MCYKGYGVAAHVAAIHAHGPCPIHRKSFNPVRTMLKWTRPEVAALADTVGEATTVVEEAKAEKAPRKGVKAAKGNVKSTRCKLAIPNEPAANGKRASKKAGAAAAAAAPPETTSEVKTRGRKPNTNAASVVNETAVTAVEAPVISAKKEKQAAAPPTRSSKRKGPTTSTDTVLDTDLPVKRATKRRATKAPPTKK